MLIRLLFFSPELLPTDKEKKILPTHYSDPTLKKKKERKGKKASIRNKRDVDVVNHSFA